VHCSSKEEAECMLEKLKARMEVYDLTLHPDKTKIVYCKNYQRTENNDNESFTFLSYSFQPRARRDKFGRKKTFFVFSGTISNAAKTFIRAAIRSIMIPRWSQQTLEWFAEKLNPKIRGWVNYYTRFNRPEALGVFSYLNELIRKWLKNKYKLRSCKSVYIKYQTIQAENAALFYHWKLGIKNMTG
jgi:RNA-directed DNA polymerase